MISPADRFSTFLPGHQQSSTDTRPSHSSANQKRAHFWRVFSERQWHGPFHQTVLHSYVETEHVPREHVSVMASIYSRQFVNVLPNMWEYVAGSIHMYHLNIRRISRSIKNKQLFLKLQCTIHFHELPIPLSERYTLRGRSSRTCFFVRRLELSRKTSFQVNTSL